MRIKSSLLGMIFVGTLVALGNAHAGKGSRPSPKPAVKAPKRPTVRRQISVFGTANPTAEQERLATFVGYFLGRRGHVVLNGGKGGVMKAVSKGAKWGGGFVVGIMPDSERGKANRYVDLEIPTGLDELRNTVLASAGDGAIAIGTTPGTTSEVAWAVRQGKIVVAPKGHVQPFDTVYTVKIPKTGPEFQRIASTAKAMVEGLEDLLVEQDKEKAAKAKKKR